MLSPNQLERASEAYRFGYRDGYKGAQPSEYNATGTFNAYDYAQGYKAGANDAYWNMVHYTRQLELRQA